MAASDDVVVTGRKLNGGRSRGKRRACGAPPDYGPAAQLFTECTRRAPAHRPAARQIHEWLHGGTAPADSPTPTPPPCGVGMPTF